MNTMTRSSFPVLTEQKYELRPVVRGYNMRTLYVNVGTRAIAEKPVSETMKAKFVGGKGFGLKLLWDATNPSTKWNDPENEIIIAMGPICGNTNYPGSGKSLVVSISPLTDIPIDSNVGGFFGPYLKFSGFDALELQGKADRETILFIDGNEGLIQLLEAPADLPTDTHVLAELLTHAFARDEKDLQNVSVVSSGRAAEVSPLGLLNFSLYDKRRKGIRVKQAGRGGIGQVFRDKKLKALVVRYAGTTQNSNGAVNPAEVQR
ncbi:MAG: hypothetical protein N3A02_06840, partial [Rectinema sp.]|nr:hypothetical protein [Rectinema sp.]